VAKKREATTPQTSIDVLQRQIHTMQRRLNAMAQTGPSSIQPDDWEDALSPAPWEVMAHWPGHHPDATPHDNLVYFHPGYVDAPTGATIVEKGWKAFNDRRVKNIKIYGDRRPNRVDTTYGFRFPIEEDLHKTKISYILGFNGTEGTGATTMTVTNITRGILVATPVVPSGLRLSGAVAINEAGPVLTPNNMVFENDWFHIMITTVGAGSRGLGIYIKFS
jgi:hypothetical protein